MFEPLGSHGPPEWFSSPWKWCAHQAQYRQCKFMYIYYISYNGNSKCFT